MRATPLLLLAALWLPAHALEPSQVFDKVSPSVWIVRTFDGAERPVGQGSAVVIGPGKVVTNCHVLAKSKVVMVRRRNVMFEAKLEHADAPRDLCILQIEGFTAPAVAMRGTGDLKVGEKAFAIGNPRGFEVTLSEGLVSGLRGEWSDGSHVIQTTAPISPGSSGGGLFDAEGRLVGITTFSRRDSQNINFALPSEWIAEVPARSEAALARRKQPQQQAFAVGTPMASVPPGYPVPGTVWVYRFTERAFGRRTFDVTVRADRVDRDLIDESVFVAGGGSNVMRRTIQTREARFLQYSLGSDTALLEIAPYLVAANDGQAPAEAVSAVGYPVGGRIFAGERGGFRTRSRAHDWEEVSVPSGSYRALRYEFEGEREEGTAATSFVRSGSITRFKMNVWYAPDIQRIVKLEHKMWSKSADPISEETMELLEYRPPR
jgi:serine protease Do